MINTKMSISIQKRITTASTFISCCLHLFCSVLHCCDFDGDLQRKQYKTFLFLTNPNLHIFTHYLLYTHSHTYKIHITHAHCRKIHNTINIITHFQEYLFMLQIVTFELNFIPWWIKIDITMNNLYGIYFVMKIQYIPQVIREAAYLIYHASNLCSK